MINIANNPSFPFLIKEYNKIFDFNDIIIYSDFLIF